jgi:hypothetical protein
MILTIKRIVMQCLSRICLLHKFMQNKRFICLSRIFQRNNCNIPSFTQCNIPTGVLSIINSLLKVKIRMETSKERGEILKLVS